MAGLQYSDRLKSLGTESLEKRRLKADLCMYYKITAELVDMPVEEFFIFRHGITRNNGACIHMNTFSSNAERYYFKNRCVSSWNALPANVVSAASLIGFKRCLNSIDLHKFKKNQYDYPC